MVMERRSTSKVRHISRVRCLVGVHRLSVWLVILSEPTHKSKLRWILIGMPLGVEVASIQRSVKCHVNEVVRVD